jgi:integrase
MVRRGGRLNALAVQRAHKRGLLHDAGGLYLQVARGGAKSWLFRYMLKGRARAMGLGSLAAVSLAQARVKAALCRQQLQDGLDPIEARRAQLDRERVEAARGISFQACAEAYIAAHKAAWRSPKSLVQWQSSLAAYVYPTLGLLPVQQIDTGLVLKVLEPIWAVRPETASRVRGRVELVIDWAKARGYREGENPARWRGHLQNLLPSRRRIQAVRHFAALPYTEVGAFMTALRAEQSVVARALEFLVLTAARAAEATGARWDEIDLKAETWTIPGSRMKGARGHRVPLSSAALAVVEAMKPLRRGDHLFPGTRHGKPVSQGALLALLRRLEYRHVTTHGFRSGLRDWAAEMTVFPGEVAEMALAHAVGNKVEAAYRRGDLFEKRRRLMEEWARYCATPAKGGKVVPIRRAGE